MAGSFGEMGNLLKQAQEMQRQLERIRSELAEAVVEGTAGGGAVRVEVTGDRRVQSLSISDEVIKTGDKSMIEDLVLSAVQDGLTKAEQLAEQTMTKVTGGMQLPGMF
ncbi:YbaB/EbfC family nucleoid-associated protein [Engelhardtia mirabilis]|uniref:Nucleoid-associated protein Pla133_39120 n=1 Tax=Engelhardtia mirabilis TaxID=2528011 RepID=A0A518BPA7_9BACT|nr:Nucleoid-associated protein [Planctomycetes bacterium Pla133]QDV03136.1 Nucleoid-associated protein [Planctomycetes bacterium Pla86]